MRRSASSALLAASLFLTSCSSSSGPESLMAGLPSREVTNSVVPAAPVPAASVGQPAAQQQQVLAWDGEVPEPQAFAPVATTVGMPLPSQRPIAMLVPDKPTGNSSSKRSRVYSQRFDDAKPINFGKVKPKHYAVHGVDVSRWQADMDWVTLRKHGANFAYIKATDGGDHLDPMFKTNWKRAKDAGIRRGAYHFFYWCRAASEQADWFIRNVPRDPDALPPVIDVEYNGQSSCKMRLSRARVQEKMQVFMDMVEKHYGKRPVIYTAPDFYKDNLVGAFENYPFWLRAVAEHPSKVYPGRKWLFWQYSGSGLSQGVDGKIDLNVFNGSEDGWHNWVARHAS
jgi:lysozyme